MTRRLVALLLAVLAVAAAANASPARAGTYTVAACTSGGGTGVNHLFSGYGSGNAYYGGCSNGRGLWADVWSPTGFLSSANWRVNAPGGTSIAGYSMNMGALWAASGWGAQVDDTNQFLSGPCFGGVPCGWLTSGSSWGWTNVSRSGIAVGSLHLVSYCIASACMLGQVQASWSDIYVTFADGVSPWLAAVRGGLWTSNGSWIRGTQAVGFDATDGTGIQRMRAEVDPGGAHGFGWPADQGFGCDYTYAAPCGNHALDTSFDTAQLGDGTHSIRISAADASGNWGSSTHPLNVDNHPPAPPALSVDGGGATTSTNSWNLRWTNPAGQYAPITTVHYEVCRADGTGCTTASTPVQSGGSGQANSISGSFGISSPGTYTVRVWLEDAAGNVDASSRSNPVTLDYDGGLVGAAELGVPPSYWLNAQDATTWAEPIRMAPGEPVPASGIAGYAVTIDGSDPGTTVNAPADAAGDARYGPPPGGWPDGTVTVKARAISGTGKAGPIAQTTLHADRTAPATGALGAGNGSDWQPGPVNVTLYGTDSASGMGGADADQPVESGAYIAYTLDGGDLQKVRGGAAKVAVTADGAHTIVMRAYDVAGNVSADRTISVRLGTAASSSAGAAVGFSARSANPGTRFEAANSFGGDCPSRATLAPIRDTYVDQAQSSQPYAAASRLVVRSGGGQNARALLAFALPAANGCAVTSATLRLHAASSTPGRTLEVYRLGSAWDDAVTWSTRPGASGEAATAQSMAEGWVSFDVTSQLQNVYRYGDNGLVARDSQGGDSPVAGQAFDSSEGDPALRPELVVDFG